MITVNKGDLPPRGAFLVPGRGSRKLADCTRSICEALPRYQSRAAQTQQLLEKSAGRGQIAPITVSGRSPAQAGERPAATDRAIHYGIAG